MDGATNNNSGPNATKITEDHQTSPAPIETVSRALFSSDYYRKVDRTTDIAGRLPNAVFTLPPRLVQAIICLAEVTDATREALVAGCKKFFLACREYEESKEVFVDMNDHRNTTITLDCGRLYSEGYNFSGQCGIGLEKGEVTGPRLIRLPPVLQAWCAHHRWFAKTTRGLYAWGNNFYGTLGLGDDDLINQPRRVPIDSEVLDLCQTSDQSFFRTASGWLGCGDNSYGQLALGHTDRVTAPTPIPGSEGVTRWAGVNVTFAFTDNGLLASGDNRYGQCGVGSTDDEITTLTPIALPDDVKGRVDRVVYGNGSCFIIAGRRCFASGLNRYGQLGIGSDERRIFTPIELPLPVDDIISHSFVTVIRSGDTLLACGDNENIQITTADTPKVTTPTPLDLPGPVVKVVYSWNCILVQLTDGAWVGRGRYEGNDFIPIPEVDLIERYYLPGWTPVTDGYAKKMNGWKRAMLLPEPITNNQESYDEIFRPTSETPVSPSSPAPRRCIAV